MIKLSVVIITFNEGKNIRRCLESVKGIADEIIVVDSSSIDNTKAICQEFGVRFFDQDFLGYIEQKNYANSLATFDHILSIDADEALSDELLQSIIEIKTSCEKDAYSMNRITNFCGKWIKHSGWYPDRKIRIFDRRKGRWTGKKIHEKIGLDKGASTGFLKGNLLHYSFYTIEQHVNQINKFSTIKAEVLMETGGKSNLFKIWLGPIATFFQVYLFKLGFLDGTSGFLIAKNTAFSTLLKYSKLSLMLRQKKQKQS
jgi:glycosyltransferase involved in cell wall biosynthesis